MFEIGKRLLSDKTHPVNFTEPSIFRLALDCYYYMPEILLKNKQLALSDCVLEYLF